MLIVTALPLLRALRPHDRDTTIRPGRKSAGIVGRARFGSSPSRINTLPVECAGVEARRVWIGAAQERRERKRCCGSHYRPNADRMLVALAAFCRKVVMPSISSVVRSIE